MFDVIAFDADDTLWHCERDFQAVHESFLGLLSAFHERDWIEARLLEVERRNLGTFGYGVKGFVLSMIETAVELTEGRVTGQEIQRIVDWGKGMVHGPVDTLPGVAETLAMLAKTHQLMVITKGDLFDQESKVARSGLGGHFMAVEVVSEKTEAAYRSVMARHRIHPDRFLMVGNSLKSDILPVRALGARAVHVPYPLTWALERVEGVTPESHGYHVVENLVALPELLARLR
jgi:putative hydrolase of the HAD superfamily